MTALVLSKEEDVKFVEVPCPSIVHAGDAIIKVTACSVCGSDLHPYHGRERGIAPNTIVGHEFVGVVVAKGPEVKDLDLGDRVASPFTSCCGQCFYCERGATCRCDHTQAHLFGWVSEGEEQLPPEQRRGLQGSQAQYVRVPLASGTLLKLPDDVSDEAGLLLGDILSTAFFCAERGEVGDGATVAVLGCGPVGLLAVMAAKHLGASQIFAVDAVPERLAVAAELGAQPLLLGSTRPAHASGEADEEREAKRQKAEAGESAAAETPSMSSGGADEVVAAVKAATEGRGVDTVLEAVGSNSALRLGYDLVRPMGTISSVGVNTSAEFPFSPVDAYNRNITFRSGRCPARAYMTKLMGLVREPPAAAAAGAAPTAAAGKSALPWRRIFTHRMPLSQGPQAYDMFARRADGVIKIVLDPWA
ncbi:hypothetical protein CHLRE_10g431550v5 [Chlamydomonas reinhardtii]|uniref:Enoyl reductase (ER) domain-containing protein n=1 Tax=Chlamydomonas reinhardtii TaxID=3055 RepID=A8IB95_CHLRE|nr:uncharacterized protein CHLRE_10g431550v5 [Chlamydomonas reinhardtii]PNW77323.1 hypothetical protein CHLRE_10g431550v5 [Chlamydomonas reinhardtii]|eukprot:XP_001702676.1 predicted protein [Chlamydomonas reinhardtii]